MCGIVGYVGGQAAAPLLLEGLARLEYRGYDSAGIALCDGGRIYVYKAKGRLQVLRERLRGQGLPATVGIGHTRWATHGRPSDRNAHPHSSQNGLFAVVHNGIVENYAALKAELQAAGVTFTSETDSEVIAQLLEREYDGDVQAAIGRVLSRLEGSYALGIVCAAQPDAVWAVRQASPLVVGLCEDGCFIASDVPAVLPYTRRVCYLADGDCACLRADGVCVSDAQGHPVQREEIRVDWEMAAAEKGGYAHFMLKEIMEQPTALAATVSSYTDTEGHITLDGAALTPERAAAVCRIAIVGCGSAYHTGVAAKYVLERLTRIPTEVELASEFRYRGPVVDAHTLVIAVSQSGETADTLAAVREARRRGAWVLAVVNVAGSSIAAESDGVLYTRAGPEIAVATTKAYSTQLAAHYLIALWLAEKRGQLSPAQTRRYLTVLERLPDAITQILRQTDAVERLAQRLAGAEHAYFIGRNLDYAVAMEAALKLKEISYIHAEAYAAGELKHGTISLIEEGTPVVGIACCEAVTDKTLSNLQEVKARGAEVLLVTTAHLDGAGVAEHVLYVPRTEPLFTPSLAVVPMQLLGYYVARARGCDIDKPRNLAKSVTVE